MLELNWSQALDLFGVRVEHRGAAQLSKRMRVLKTEHLTNPPIGSKMQDRYELLGFFDLAQSQHGRFGSKSKQYRTDLINAFACLVGSVRNVDSSGSSS